MNSNNRLNLYDSLSDMGKSLMILLYGSKSDYVRGVHEDPLEESVISFDQNMGNPSLLYDIAASIGMMIEKTNYTGTAIDFITRFSGYVKIRNDIQVMGGPSYQELIKMSPTDFEKYIQTLGSRTLPEDIYDDRVIQVYKLLFRSKQLAS